MDRLFLVLEKTVKSVLVVYLALIMIMAFLIAAPFYVAGSTARHLR